MSSQEAGVEKPKGIRWWPFFYIVGLVGVSAWIGYLHFEWQEDRTYQFFVINAATMLTVILLTLWWLLFSRARWWARILLPAAIAAGAWGTVRFDGWSGEMVPRFSWKWKKPKPLTSAASPRVASTNAITESNLGEYELKETDWPGFRGADRLGIVKGAAFAPAWLKPTERWRIPMGKGWSSFAVVGSLAWTQEQQGEEEQVNCYDALTGARVWSHSDQARFYHFMGGAGPRATPTYHAGRIYALGATGILNCLVAATGKRIWSRRILEDAKARNIDWGMAGSPLVYGSTVIVSPGGTNGFNAVAYDLESGEIRWHAGPWVASYSSPQLARVLGTEQILIHHGQGVSAYDPADGNVLWNRKWTNDPKINVAQPTVYGEGAVMLSSGYGRGSILLDVSRDGDGWKTEERWRSIRLKSKFSAFVLRGRHVFGLDENYLACIDIESGRRMWKGDKYGYGQVLLVGDVLLVMSEQGEVAFVKASPVEFEEIGRFKALEGKTWNHPVIANGRLYVRNGEEAACFDLSAGQESSPAVARVD